MTLDDKLDLMALQIVLDNGTVSYPDGRKVVLGQNLLTEPYTLPDPVFAKLFDCARARARTLLREARRPTDD